MKHALKLIILISTLFISTLCMSASENLPNRLVAFTYPDSQSSDFLKAVLTSLNLPFTVKDTQNGQYIEWPTDNDEQVTEIQRRVSQYNFVKDICKGLPLPSPSTPSRNKISC